MVEGVSGEVKGGLWHARVKWRRVTLLSTRNDEPHQEVTQLAPSRDHWVFSVGNDCKVTWASKLSQWQPPVYTHPLPSTILYHRLPTWREGKNIWSFKNFRQPLPCHEHNIYHDISQSIASPFLHQKRWKYYFLHNQMLTHCRHSVDVCRCVSGTWTVPMCSTTNNMQHILAKPTFERSTTSTGW